MTKFISNIKNAFVAEADENKDRGTLVETVIIVAGFALVALLLVQWIGTAILNKGADIAQCIEGVNLYEGSNDSAENCADANHGATNSFKDDDGYTNRYGGNGG